MKQILFNPNIAEIDEYLELAQKYNAGFEYTDFILPQVLDNESQMRNLIGVYKNLGRDTSKDTLHGVFYDICVNTCDELIYKACDYRVHQSMECAKKLGVRGVVFHTNFIANFKTPYYFEVWLSGNYKYWTKICKEYRNIDIYLENMFDMDDYLLTKLCEMMSDVPNFHACFDVAHAHLAPENIEGWMGSLRNYISHIHINDNYGNFDSHNEMGDGTIDWRLFSDIAFMFKEPPSVVVEMTGIEKLKRSLEFMELHDIYPLDRRR